MCEVAGAGRRRPRMEQGLKECKKTSQKTSMNRPADGPGGIKPRPTKRVHADLPTNTRTTRSMRELLQDVDASTQREGMSDPKCLTASVAHARHDKEVVCNFDDHTQHGVRI